MPGSDRPSVDVERISSRKACGAIQEWLTWSEGPGKLSSPAKPHANSHEPVSTNMANISPGGDSVPVTPDQALARARSQIGRLRYVLGTGGRKPGNKSPGDTTLACDCSGFVSWALGMDRKQPGFGRWGWISTDSLVAMARLPDNGWFEEIPRPEAGCLVVYPGKYFKGRRIQVGHVGLVSKVPAEWSANYGDLRVIHCSAGSQRVRGYAVAETDGRIWAGKGAMFLRFLKFANG